MSERTKAERLLNPREPSDYAVTLTAEEALQVPEIAAWIAAIIVARREEKAALALARKMGRNAGAAVGAIAAAAIADGAA